MTYTPIYTSVNAVYAKTGLSATEIDLTDDNILRACIEEAEVEVEFLTGRKFTSGNAITEYYSSNGQDVIGNYQTTISILRYPIQSITAFQILNTDGTASSTFDTLTAVQIAAGTVSTDDYWLETKIDPLTMLSVPSGTVRLKTDTFPKGNNNIKVSYTYGYTTVPVPVKGLATCLAGIKCWIRFLGGQYNRLDSYSIPQQSVNKGNFYQRGKQNIDLLQAEADNLLNRIGRKLRTSFYATGGTR